MDKIVNEIQVVRSERLSLLKKEDELICDLMQQNETMMYAYLEKPIFNDDAKEILVSIKNHDGFDNDNVNKVYVLNIELPGHHLNIISSFWFIDNYSNYVVEASSEQDGWCGMWSGEPDREQVLELNTKKFNDKLETFYCAKGNELVFLSKANCHKKNLFDFIKDSCELAKKSISEEFKTNNILSGKVKVLSGKSVVIDKDLESDVVGKLTDLTDTLINDLRKKDYVLLEETTDSYEINGLNSVIDKFNSIYNREILENELEIKKQPSKTIKV